MRAPSALGSVPDLVTIVSKQGLLNRSGCGRTLRLGVSTRAMPSRLLGWPVGGAAPMAPGQKKFTAAEDFGSL